MKFIFKNLGPIHEAELELGDMTIIAGRNNTGKTYVAYTLYGFLDRYSDFPQLSESFDEFVQESPFYDDSVQVPDIDKLAKIVMEEGQVKWTVEESGLSLTRKVVTQTIDRNFSERYLSRVFSSPGEDFNDASIETVPDEEFPKYSSIESINFRGRATLRLSHQYDGIRISMRRSKKSPSHADVSSDLSDLFLWFFLAEFPSPFILSAERFGISLFYKELDFRKDRVVEVLQEMGKDIERERSLPFRVVNKMASRYALPVRRNINYTRSIPNLRGEQSGIYESKLFNDIRNMMGGHYRSSDDDIRFKSRSRKKDSFDIPLHMASSSVRELSDLYFFLRHVAQEDQLLIIDEPESHLDTANQIQFARLLARAVRAGLKVLITTHSDYIVKEINNLLMLSQDFEEKPRVLKKHGYSEHDFLKADSVRAYVAEKNSLTRCTIDRFGINMPVFDTTIDAINRVSSELSVRLKYEGEE